MVDILEGKKSLKETYAIGTDFIEDMSIYEERNRKFLDTVYLGGFKMKRIIDK